MKNLFLKLFIIPMLILNFACSSTNTKVKTHSSSITDRTYESNTRFFVTFTTRRSNKVEDFDKTFVRIHNAIPNSSLTYLYNKILRSDTKLFRADYTIDVRFSQEGKFIFNRIFNAFVEEESYDDTQNNLYYLSTLDVLVDPGKYDIEIFYQSDVRKAITKINNVVVPNYNVFSIASPHLLHRNGKKDINGKSVPRFNINYTNFLTDEDLFFLTELYNVKVGRIDFKFEFFKSDDLKQTSYTSMTVDSVADIYKLSYPIAVKVHDLIEGEYLLKIKISDTFNNTATTEIRIFKERNIIKYSSNKDWKDSIRLLGFIAKHDEIKILKKLKTEEDRRAGVYSFWKKRDKGENLFVAKAYFYQRVQFVNNRWGLNKRPGWKTDRGRIHIKHGEPDFIYRAPMNGRMSILRGMPFEIWTYYRIDRIFRFVDTSRTGTDYRLKLVTNRRGDNLGLNEDVRR